MQMSEILGALDDDDTTGLDEILGELLEGDEAILGDDESLGEDDMAILGAALRAKGRKGKNVLAKAIAARKLGSAQVMTPKRPTSSGVQAIGFEQLGILGGAAALITVQPQTWFKPQRFVVPDSIAPFFTLNDILVGNLSQFPSPLPLPCEGFIPSAVAVVMDLATVNPALNLSIRVTNISGVAQNFRAMFVGKQVTP